MTHFCNKVKQMNIYARYLAYALPSYSFCKTLKAYCANWITSFYLIYSCELYYTYAVDYY